MSIRVLALYVIVAGLSVYARKDWLRSLCGLILLMAIIEHRDMPKTMFGILGLNPWNVLFAAVFIAWAASRHRERFRWGMPREVSVLLLLYLGVILVGVLRAAIDRSHLESYPLSSLFAEELFNTIKWVLPGLLLFDGCRTRKRVMMALTSLLVMYLVTSILVIRNMPAMAALGDGEAMNRCRIKLAACVGHSACDLSAMLAGASWGILAAMPLVRMKSYRVAVLAGAGVISFGQALTGGRAGYAAWGLVGLTLCLLKWRKYLIFAPVVVILLPIILPGAAARMREGFGQTNVAGQATVDEEGVLSGRAIAWPYVIDKIGESPFVGYGRLAMKRVGLRDRIEIEHRGTLAPHPHNMYLETLLDNGILGSIPIFLFWGTMLLYSAALFRSNNRLYSAVGGLTLALMLAQLFAGIGSQHFYPRESTLGVWTAIFLALRVYVEERRAQMAALQSEVIWDAPLVTPQRKVVFTHPRGTASQ